ncbi:MAG: hypothetical protein QW512_06085 [Thermofilaceae archaeon]
MLVRVWLAVVVLRDTHSSLRRRAYEILRDSAIPTPLGWLLLTEMAYRRLEAFRRKYLEKRGVEVVRLYRVGFKPGELLKLIRESREDGGDWPQHVRNYVSKLEKELEEATRKP